MLYSIGLTLASFAAWRRTHEQTPYKSYSMAKTNYRFLLKASQVSSAFFRVLIDQVLKLLGCDRALEKRLRLFLDDHNVSQHSETSREGRCQMRGGM